jgi:hypothetical protein
MHSSQRVASIAHASGFADEAYLDSVHARIAGAA